MPGVNPTYLMLAYANHQASSVQSRHLHQSSTFSTNFTLINKSTVRKSCAFQVVYCKTKGAQKKRSVSECESGVLLEWCVLLAL